MHRRTGQKGFAISVTLCWGSWNFKRDFTRSCTLTWTFTTAMVCVNSVSCIKHRRQSNIGYPSSSLPIVLCLGVENAFQFSDKVLTVSLHHFAEGFYPGTGNGRLPSPRSKAVVNIPLKSGLSDGNLIRIFDGMIEPLKESFSPDAIVLQCGVDGKEGQSS